MARTCGQPQSQWDQFSSEVWGVIFAQLPTRPGVYKLQTVLCKLPLVCSKFHNIMSGQPNMCTRLLLFEALAGNHVPHLLGFIRRHSGSIRELSVSSGEEYPRLELVLATLLTHQAPVSRVDGHIPNEAMHLLAALKTLVHCNLHGRQGASVSLQPLRSLPNLTILNLAEGPFTMVDAAAQHLTRLALVDCKASCFEDCLCVTSLRHLCCRHSNLSRFHQEGLPACSQLQSLLCDSSNIHAGDAAESVLFGAPDHCVPLSISALTALSLLSFRCDAEVRRVELDWLTQLTALEKLEAKLAAECIVLPESLSTLSRLRGLFVAATRDEHTQVTLDFDFSHLVALEELCIFSDFHARAYGLLNLADLNRLRFVAISRSTDKHMMDQLALLAHKLEKHRPDIYFVTDSE